MQVLGIDLGFSPKEKTVQIPLRLVQSLIEYD